VSEHEIPARLNPSNDPARAEALLRSQAGMLAALDRQVEVVSEGKQRFPDRWNWDDLLARLERIRGHVLRWEDIDPEHSDYEIEGDRMVAEAMSQFARSSAPIMQKIVNITPEQLETLTPLQQAEHFDLVKELEQRKEELLGVLPIEERKKIENNQPGSP
jgi:hypothetical protein